VRRASEALCAPLAVDDYGVQPMADASPAKWHLAHTTWFFETFLLHPYARGYQAFHPQFEHLFNSYYQGVGQPYPRGRRGVLSRPTVADVYAYRRHVDAAMARLLEHLDGDVAERLMLGLQHEQQHQELLLTDLKVTFGTNPLLPAYRSDLPSSAGVDPGPLQFVAFAGGVYPVGADAGARAFCFDNETPRHDVLLRPFALADRPASNAEYLAFVDDGGYRRPDLWLSDGWAALAGSSIDVAARDVPAAQPMPGPMYWFRRSGDWWEYRLGGAARLDPGAPVTHISYYEADAFARWCGCRLPTEQEWEVAAAPLDPVGHFADRDRLHPAAVALTPGAPALRQMFGDVWEWTASPYVPYPGYRPLPGTLGEYNGKFMSNQLVLRGGSCVSAPGHLRASYRNFFYPADQWQFTGIRLARDV
jgi:ergothioneine biosynthesis protein EgtB